MDVDGDGVVEGNGGSELGGVASEWLGTFGGVAFGESNAGLSVAGDDSEGVAVDDSDDASCERLGKYRCTQEEEKEKAAA